MDETIKFFDTVHYAMLEKSDKLFMYTCFLSFRKRDRNRLHRSTAPARPIAPAYDSSISIRGPPRPGRGLSDPGRRSIGPPPG